MSRTISRLLVALSLSLLLHALPFVAALIEATPRPAPTAAPPLQASLKPTPAAVPVVPLHLEESQPAQESLAKKRTIQQTTTKTAKSKKTWTQEIRRQFSRQQAAGLFYPPEAIARGLEGEALVFMLLDADGQVSAARIEQSSGQPLLDAAALRAVRALRALPADAPRETLLPVRFRLR